MTRIAWIFVGLCTATLALAQMARPPDAPPAAALSATERAEFDNLADRIPDYHKTLMMDFIDSGYEFSNAQNIRECVDTAN